VGVNVNAFIEKLHIWVTHPEKKELQPIPTYFGVHRKSIDEKQVITETLFTTMKTHVNEERCYNIFLLIVMMQEKEGYQMHLMKILL